MAKKIDINLEEVRQLASKGYSTLMICSAIGVSKSYVYAHKDIVDTIKRGSDEAKRAVIDHLMARSMSDQGATASIFLAKQLKAFDDPYTTSTPKTILEASKRIGKIYTDVARGDLDQEKGDRLVSYLEKFIKSVEVSTLEVQLMELTNWMKEEKQSKGRR